MSDYLLTPAEQKTLGWAIKATGRTAHDIDEHGAWFKCENDSIVGAWSKFNSFTSDADAFRLMVALQMTLVVNYDQTRAQSATGQQYTVITHSDACCAARQAITMCAALIGGYKP